MENLGHFDPSTMTYLATQMAHPSAGGGGGGGGGAGGNSDPFQDMLLPMGMQEQPSVYGYAGSDDFNLHPLHPQQTPQLKRFSSAYDDPFSDVVSAFDPPPNPDQDQPDAEPQIERDNKLLGFSPPAFDYTLLDYTYRRTALSLSAQLHGMFFLAESPWTSAGDAQAPPSELTCYRRNLFQITGEITIPRTLRYIMTEQGEQIPIIGQELAIGATESSEGNAVKIISVPWKTPVNPNAAPADEKAEREPPSIPLDLMNVQDLDSDLASFPFQWKRLQFRIATANNGRRKELQQHFVVRLKVLATLATGGKIPICEVQSGPIIVRGRSPRNFQSRKDQPLSGSGHARKASHNTMAQMSRASTNDSTKQGPINPGAAPTSAPVKTEAPPLANLPPTFFDDGAEQLDGAFFDWKGGTAHAHPGAMTALPPTTSPFEGGGVHAHSSPDASRHPATSQPPPAAPINLSLVEDDATPTTKRPSATPPSHQPSAKRLALPARPPSFSLHPAALNSPDESADLLYEYFPLGLDDWMPPVDAVYRPHVVHHTKLPSDPRDPKTHAKAGRNKRYFSQEVS